MVLKTWNCDGVVTHLEPDILECKVKWVLESITTAKLVGIMEFQQKYLKSKAIMLLKCCTQYVSKFGKLSSGRRAGKGQFSFQSQRKAMPKNAQTTAQLLSFHMLVTATAAAKSLQSCPTLCDPIDSSPLGSSVPGILQARTLERVAISFSNA